MVKIIQKENKNLYQCERCGFYYKEKEWAEKCEQWCKTHNSCNLEITSHAVREFSKKEEYLQKKQIKEERLQLQRRKNIRRVALKVGIVLILLAVVSVGIWFFTLQSKSESQSESQQKTASKIIATQGIHWHPRLSIKILGQEREIPAGIGLGVTERPIHTHEADGVIHLEFSGRVTEADVRLGKFFDIWGKTFNRDCILERCNGQDGQVQMFINGKQNFEFENDIMRDNDIIEIVFEFE